jgi:RHS repeat-associated protein
VRISLFDRKDLFPMNHSRLFAILLFIFAAFQTNPARAQIQTLYYSGPTFNLADCTHGSPPCIAGGSVYGSITYWGVSYNYTGYVHLNQAIASTESAAGFGTLGFSQATSADLYLNNGSVEAWDWDSASNPTNTNTIIGASDVGDSGNITVAGTLTQQGVANQTSTAYGTWFSPIALGAICAAEAPSDAPPPSGKASCGDPVDVGSGNLFESAPDYSTIGQNPLGFTRYYNSFSLPDTYAVALGSNWRHNFDRYLHIINPSAIYGVAAERETGQSINFSSSSGTYSSDTDLDYTLARSGSGPAWTWTLTDPDDTVETYSQSGAEATLSTIKLRNGYTQTMHYTSGRLSSVTDTYGRTLSLTYTSGLLTSLATPDALNLTYGYVAFASGGHLLSTVTYNTSPATHQGYTYFTSSSQLAGITDENGHSYAAWTYDSTGRMATSQLAGGVNYTSVSYFDASGGDRKVTGPLGITETYKFSTLQGVPKVTEIDRAANGTVTFASEGFTYDTNGYPATATDWNGNQTAYTNNSHGLPTQIVYASGSSVSHTTSITYDTTWARLAHIITTPGLTVTNNYSSTNGTLLTRVLKDTTSTSSPYSTNGQTRTWTYTYTSSGQLATAQLPRTDVTAKTTYTYTGGVLTNIKDALNHNTHVATYKNGGLPLTVRDPNNTLTTFAYSTRLWLTSAVMTTSAGSLTTSMTFDSAGELTKTTLPDSSYLAYTYNNAHQLTKTTNANSETANFTYDSAGDLTQTLWKNSAGTTKRQHTATYDALGRRLTDVGGASQTTTFGYDSDDNVTKITDPLSNVTTQTFDALNRLKTSKNAVHDQVQITYNAHDLPLTVTDGKSNATTFVYDGFNEAISQVSPDSGTSVFWYNPDGDVTKQSAFAVTNYTYDALDRLLTRAYPADSTLNVSLTWDQTTGHGTGTGNLTSVTDQAGSLALSYDQRNLLTSNARTISSNTYTTGYTFQSAGLLASITYASSGWVVKYGRDSAGQVTSVTDTQPGHGATNLATSITHMPFGPVSGLTYGNGVTDTRTYDLDYRMTAVKDAGSSNIQYLSFGYNAANNVTSITDNVTSANNQTLTYDAVDRLKTATGSYGTISSITYDSNSNRLTYGSTSYTIPAGSNKMSASAGSSITYSSTGNVTAIGTTPTFTWNKANQMATAVVSGTTSTYLYGFDGMRLKTTVGAGTPSVIEYDPAGEILTETNSGTETDYAWLDNFPIAAIQPGAATISAIHTNNIGTPQKATNASKTVVWTGNYDPNGKVSPTASITMNLRLPGQYASASGFNQNGFRDYNPNSATGAPRYLEVDPIGLVGGINPYPYAGQNAISNTDPSGLWFAGFLDNLAGGFIGGGVDVAGQMYRSWTPLMQGQPFYLDKKELSASIAAGFVTDGLSALSTKYIAGLGLKTAAQYAARTAANASIAGATNAAQTAFLNWAECRDDNVAQAAVLGFGLGAVGSGLQDSILYRQVSQLAQFDSYSAGEKIFNIQLAAANGMTLLTSPGKGTVAGASFANASISGGSSFIGGPTGSLCTCRHP